MAFDFGKKDDKKDGDDKDKKEKKVPDFSAEDKAELKQSKPDTVILHPRVKDLVEKILDMRKGR